MANQYLNQCLHIIHDTRGNEFQLSCKKQPFLIRKNGFENVICKMAAICTRSIDTKITMVARYIYTEALKGHRVLWKIEICYLIRMT